MDQQKQKDQGAPAARAAPIVAIVDRRGRLFCVHCAACRDLTGEPVYLDAAPHNEELCESCGRMVGGDECSICRSRHGREIVHACE